MLLLYLVFQTFNVSVVFLWFLHEEMSDEDCDPEDDDQNQQNKH